MIKKTNKLAPIHPGEILREEFMKPHSADDSRQAELEIVESLLGKPAYKRPGVLLYVGDCIELMRLLPAELFRLTVTSPPYNIGKEYEDPLHVDAYLDWCSTWMEEIHRLTSADGAFWLNLGYFSLQNKAKAIPISYLLWQRVSFYLLQEIVWNYGAGVACTKMFSPRNEKFLWYVKNPENYTFNLDEVRDPDVKYPNQKKNGKLKCNPLGKNPSDVWQIPKVTSGKDRSSDERTPHPAQFPRALIERILKACSNPGEIVLDPFMGSGSLAEAALRTGRNAVGFEVRQDYVEIAGRRLDAFLEKRALEQAQGSLFRA